MTHYVDQKGDMSIPAFRYSGPSCLLDKIELHKSKFACIGGIEYSQVGRQRNMQRTFSFNLCKQRFISSCNAMWHWATTPLARSWQSPQRCQVDRIVHLWTSDMELRAAFVEMKGRSSSNHADIHNPTDFQSLCKARQRLARTVFRLESTALTSS